MDSAKPEELGFSSERLARIAPCMNGYVEEGKLAGVVALIARDMKTAYFREFGKADLEAGKPMQLDTIFRIYSMTKPITSTAVLMLVEQGRLRLTDPVSDYLPAFKDVKVMDNLAGSGVNYVDPVRPITIHHLLTHTGGLSYGFDQNNYLDELYRGKVWTALEKNPDLTLEAYVEEIAKLPLAYHPGTSWRYSMATDVLGLLVQVASGVPFDEFLRESVFRPLQMVDTDFYVPEQKIGRFAANYGRDEAGGLKLIDAPQTSRFARPTKCPSGGGGLVSTAGDYLRFAQMLLNRGELDGERLLGRKTVELMMSNHLAGGVHPFDNEARGFGLGGAVVIDVAKSGMLGSRGMFGWGGAASTIFWIDPQEDMVVILMLQFMSDQPYTIDSEFVALAYQALVD